MAFTGCSGTVRFDAPAAEVSTRIMNEALEHHFALAYGDHRDALRALAVRWQVPVFELT
jgi:L-fucose isomerase-like protein